MEMITGAKPTTDLTVATMAAIAASGQPVSIHGMVHIHRDMGDFAFIILRLRDGLVQCVQDQNTTLTGADDLRDEYAITGEGLLSAEPRAPGGFELRLSKVHVPQQAAQPAPGPSRQKSIPHVPRSEPCPAADHAAPPTPTRHLQAPGRPRPRFPRLPALGRLHRSPHPENRFVSAGAEGGSNIFKLDYFGRKAFLAQSPQFYKQTMVGVFERVFEVAPVFRAEKHSTARHLNEYTSMDFEMGFIDSFEEIMAMETGMLQYTIELLKKEYANELQLLNVDLPDVAAIPQVRFDVAKQMVSEKYNRRIKDPYDLEPEEERLIGELFKEITGSDFIFVTHYPSKKRPFYAKDDPADAHFTLSFDLLFRGLEVTTGGQRIHNYDDQVAKMVARGMNPDDFESYLMIHKYGMPPHGGLGLGLERLLMMLIGETNVRNTVLFPRDLSRLDP